MKENKDQEVFLDSVNASDDLWYDVSLPVDYEGVFKYRKLSNQNILQIYADMEYDGQKDGSAVFHIPQSVCPANSKTISGLVTYKVKSTGSNYMKRNYLNIMSDGELYIPGYTNEITKYFIFYGMIDL